METFINHKQLIVNASDGEGNTFIVFDHNNLIFSVEYITNFSESSVVIWDDKKKFVEGIVWRDYIYAGITNHGKKYLESYMDIIDKNAKEF